MFIYNNPLKKDNLTIAEKKYIKYITKRRLRRKVKKEIYLYLLLHKNLNNKSFLNTQD